MKIEVAKSPLENLSAVSIDDKRNDQRIDALIVFVAKKQESKSNAKQGKNKNPKEPPSAAAKAYVEGVSKAIQTKVHTAIVDGAVSGSLNETVFFREAGIAGVRHLLTVGLGHTEDLDPETVRQAAASATNALKAAKVKCAAIAMDSLPHNSLTADVAVQAMSEGALLADYSFSEFKEKKNDAGLEKLIIVTSHKAKTYDHGVEVGTTIAECVNFARWLGDRPGNRMTPTILAEEAVKASKGSKLKVNVWDKSRIKSEKMGAFLSVSLGSSQEPKLIIMEYNGATGSQKPICFVGKGLTFDSGGISIKPSAGMEEMKYDMCGGAAVIATMLAIARLKLKMNAIAFVPATENMPGPAANKPGDIVTARNGKTIEINNTDAEGRLILSDALVYACEQEPALILDAATLTGAVVVALGNTHTGYFTRNEKLADKIQAAAERSGEWIWRMPLTDFHAKDMKGTYADLSNTSASKGAGSATAAAFLEQFVDKDIPWAHFDIAGTAWHVGDRLPYCPRKGASGAMVRTFLQIAMNQE